LGTRPASGLPTDGHFLIAASSAPTATLENRLGAIRTTSPRNHDDVNITASYTEVSRAVKAQGLLARATGFYALVTAGLVLATAADITGMILLGHSWFQLILAGVLGLILTQFAFISHEAAHRQVLKSGPANDRLGRFIGPFMIGMSYAWWMNKHTR